MLIHHVLLLKLICFYEISFQPCIFPEFLQQAAADMVKSPYIHFMEVDLNALPGQLIGEPCHKLLGRLHCIGDNHDLLRLHFPVPDQTKDPLDNCIGLSCSRTCYNQGRSFGVDCFILVRILNTFHKKLLCE